MTITKKYLFILTLLFMSLSSLSQRFSPDFWHDGGIVLNNGDTLKGKVYYSLQENAVQLDSDSKIRYFKAFKLHGIYFYSSLDSNFREFRVLEVEQDNGYKVPEFFEFFHQGENGIDLLGRERLVFTRKGSGAVGFNEPGVTMGYDLYIRDSSGIHYIDNRKKYYLNVFGVNKNEIEIFINKNNFQSNNKNGGNSFKIKTYKNQLPRNYMK